MKNNSESSIHTLTSIAGIADVIIHPPIEHLQSFWQGGKFFESVMLEHIWQRYSGGVFIDVGSAIGNHTLFFAKFCSPSQVISIEPMPFQIEHQREILALNSVADKVRILNVALSDKRGRCDMEHFAGSLGQYRVKDKIVGTEGDTIVTTLDDVVSDMHLSDITLIKIDVEHHEMPVLKGAVNTLTNYSPALFIEIVGQPMHPIETFLSQFGYTRISDRFPRANAFEFVKGDK